MKISTDCVARNLEQIVKCLRLDTSLSQVSKFDGVALEICGLGRSIRLQMFFIIGVLNPLTINVPHHVETSQLICNINQLTGFYMMGNIGR